MPNTFRSPIASVCLSHCLAGAALECGAARQQAPGMFSRGFQIMRHTGRSAAVPTTSNLAKPLGVVTEALGISWYLLIFQCLLQSFTQKLVSFDHWQPRNSSRHSLGVLHPSLHVVVCDGSRATAHRLRTGPLHGRLVARQ